MRILHKKKNGGGHFICVLLWNERGFYIFFTVQKKPKALLKKYMSGNILNKRNKRKNKNPN